MTSKTKKKASSSEQIAGNTPGKKVRKKVRRRASIGHTDLQGNDDSQDSIEIGFSASMEDLRVDPYGRDSSDKMASYRTMATEMSSSHHSSDHKSLRSPKSKSSKKGSKKSSSLKNTEGQWWHIDDDGIPLDKVHKKKKGADRLSQTEHLPSTSSSPMTPVSVKKKKKKASKPVKHLSSSSHGLDHATVNTTGTGSLRPKPRRLKSQPDMSASYDQYESFHPLGGGISRSVHELRPPGLKRTPSGDLDKLMSQSVHDHVRMTPLSSEKPKLGKSSKSTLGKIGKKLGKSLGISSKNIYTAKDSFYNNSNHDSERSGSRSGHDTVKSNVSGTSNKPLPKDIREIDGVLWRVDENGNKLNKVRRKNPNKKNQNSASSGDETDIKSQASQDMSDYRYSNNSLSAWANDDGSDESFANVPSPARRKAQRRNSMGSHGKHSRKQKPESERSVYTNLNDQMPKTPKKGRSKSMDHIGISPISQTSNHTQQSSYSIARKQIKKDQVVIQNLQHRLQNSEKEIARLCRATMDQQDKMDQSRTELKDIRDKLQIANHDKRSLIIDVENLKLQLEKRRERSNKSLNGTSADELREQLCDLEEEKESLEKKLATEKEMAKNKLQAKEEEVRFLQEELERMRSEHGDKQFAYMQKLAMSDDEDSMYSNSTSQRRMNGAGKSLQFVGKILGNHLKDKAETEIALQQEEIRNLQARVFSLQQSNEKLSKELKQASLEIREDDDADVRLAKEAAARAVEVASMQNPKKDLKSKVMSLSRIHRTSSEGDNESLSLSFRGGVGDCVRRRGSIGGGGESERSLTSFRGHGSSGLY